MYQVGKGIAPDKAELLSIIFEGILYGFSLFMFVGTLWALLSRRSTRHVNHKILTIACLLLLVSTTHFVIDIVRLVEGFVLYRNLHFARPSKYFTDVSQWTFVYRHYVFTAQTLLGDAVVLYRCYVVWQLKRIMILPVLLWCAVGATGIGSAYAASQVRQASIFGGSLLPWITSFWVSALATNGLATLLLACRIWYVDRQAKRVHGPGRSHLRPMMHFIIDAGIIYSIALIAALISFLCRSNFQYAMVTPIVSITFYMVIIRVGTNRAKLSMNVPLDDASGDDTDREQHMQVHITTLTESKVDDGHPQVEHDRDRDARRDKRKGMLGGAV